MGQEWKTILGPGKLRILGTDFLVSPSVSSTPSCYETRNSGVTLTTSASWPHKIHHQVYQWHSRVSHTHIPLSSDIPLPFPAKISLLFSGFCNGLLIDLAYGTLSNLSSTLHSEKTFKRKTMSVLSLYCESIKHFNASFCFRIQTNFLKMSS